MSAENTPEFITPESMPQSVDSQEKSHVEDIPVKFIEMPEELKVNVRHNMGEAAVAPVFGQRITVEPQPGREPIVVPMPPDPSKVPGWTGEVRH